MCFLIQKERLFCSMKHTLLYTTLMKSVITTHWILRILPTIIIWQTLFFKFSAHPESVALFTKLAMEPTGRIAIWMLELIACLLLICWWQKYRLWSLLGWGLMLGAIYFHFTILGIDTLFWMACVTLLCCLIILYNERAQLKNALRLY